MTGNSLGTIKEITDEANFVKNEPVILLKIHM